MAVEVIAVDLGPGVRAGFSLRSGGASRGGHAESNLGSSVGDDPAAVAANHADLAHWLGSRPVFAHQVHGAGVRQVDLSGPPPPGPDARLDAQVARRPTGGAVARLGLGVLAADCLPVLFADPVAGVLGVAHAGRRGLAGGVLEAAVAAMVAAGAHAGDLRAVVGPGICGACYEVPEALQAEVAAAVPATACRTSAGTPGLDLPAGARGVLSGLGVGSVTVLDWCTATDDRFFSYRGAGGPAGVSGRFAGVVGFRPDAATAGPATGPTAGPVGGPTGGPDAVPADLT